MKTNCYLLSKKGGLLDKNDLIAFSECKRPFNNHNIKNLNSDAGMLASKHNNNLVLDLDHVHDDPEALEFFQKTVTKHFGEMLGVWNLEDYKDKKYKLIFYVKDSKETLFKYGKGFNIVNNKTSKEVDLEFFGIPNEKRCKLQGSYGVTDKDLKDKPYLNDYPTIKTVTNKYVKDENDNLINIHIKGRYSGDFTLKIVTAEEIIAFFEELLESGLFVLATNDEIKTPEQLHDSYRELPKALLTRLNRIANASVGVSNKEYLNNCYPYINSCVKLGYSEQECVYFMEQALIERGIKDKIKDFAYETHLIYEKAKYFIGKTLNHSLLADELIKELKIVNYNENFYYWCDTSKKYKDDVEKQVYRIAQKKIDNITISQKKEVLHSMLHKDVKTIKHADVNYIAFKNGVLDIETGELLAPTPEIFITNVIPHNYNINASSPIIDECLNNWSCNDESIINLLLECAGYCLYRNCKFKKAFVLYGDGNNGKSRYMDLLKFMLGNDNTVFSDLSKLSDKFYIIRLKDKLANISDDIQKSFNDSSTFKQVVSGDDITGKNSHKDPIDFKPYAKLVYSCNDYPHFNGSDKPINSRIITIPFENDFSNNPNTDLQVMLESSQAVEYFIKLSVEALKELLKRNKFTYSERCELQKEDFKRENNTVINFVYEKIEDTHEYYLTSNDIYTIYDHYNAWCVNNGYKSPFALNSFVRTICKEFKLTSDRKTVNGKRIRIFK